MDHNDFGNLVGQGHVSLGRVTEKTDGSKFEMGHDSQGFFTRYSGSGQERMRSRHDYFRRSIQRSKETGRPIDLGAAKVFADAHRKLEANQSLQSYLRGKAAAHGETTLSGELFHRPSAKPAEEHPNPEERHSGHVYFVGTSYHPRHLGRTGAFVLHTGLEDNQHHDPHHIVNNLGDEHMSFHHDVLDLPHSRVDVSKERARFGSVNRELLSQRTTKTNREAKQREAAKFETIKKAVSNKVDRHIRKLGVVKSKWGEGTPEGHVVHPPSDNPSQPRFKVTSDAFRRFKANKDAQEAIKKKLGK
jgi:hypothetical protein